VNGATLTTDRNGTLNSAYSFDGVSNMKIVNSNSIQNIKSVSFWFTITKVVPNSGGDCWTGFLCKSTTAANPQYRIAYESKSKKFDLMFNGKQYTFYYSKGITLNKYYNAQFVIENNVLSFYINNEKLIINSTTNYSNYNINMDLLFGQDPTGENEFHYGIIDDIAFYNRPLTQQEITNLYNGCLKETATFNSFSSPLYTNSSTVSLTAQPSGGIFTGDAVVTSNKFEPSKAKLGKNSIKYNFKNTTGCSDSTYFSVIVSDTIGNICSTYDTLKIKVKLTTGIKTGQYTAINVYPNPTSDVLIIETNDVYGLIGYTYKIVDLQGKEIYKSLVNSSKTEIVLKSIGSKGVYILHIVDEVGQIIENKKIVLE
jgi:hypothetical protein